MQEDVAFLYSRRIAVNGTLISKIDVLLPGMRYDKVALVCLSPSAGSFLYLTKRNLQFFHVSFSINIKYNFSHGDFPKYRVVEFKVVQA